MLLKRKALSQYEYRTLSQKNEQQFFHRNAQLQKYQTITRLDWSQRLKQKEKVVQQFKKFDLATIVV